MGCHSSNSNHVEPTSKPLESITIHESVKEDGNDTQKSDNLDWDFIVRVNAVIYELLGHEYSCYIIVRDDIEIPPGYIEKIGHIVEIQTGSKQLQIAPKWGNHKKKELNQLTFKNNSPKLLVLHLFIKGDIKVFVYHQKIKGEENITSPYLSATCKSGDPVPCKKPPPMFRSMDDTELNQAIREMFRLANGEESQSNNEASEPNKTLPDEEIEPFQWEQNDGGTLQDFQICKKDLYWESGKQGDVVKLSGNNKVLNAKFDRISIPLIPILPSKPPN